MRVVVGLCAAHTIKCCITCQMGPSPQLSEALFEHANVALWQHLHSRSLLVKQSWYGTIKSLHT